MSLFHVSPYKNDPCKYFPSGKMEIYDPRCRHFYELAIDVYPSLTYTSPYFVSGIPNYVATVTVANYDKKTNTPDAVYGVGVNLNYPSP